MFDPRSPYSPDRDVRSHAPLFELVRSLPHEGVLWPLIGARRAGKTWTLKGLENRIFREGGAARYVDLKRAGRNLPRPDAGSCLLLDEPELTGKGSRLRDAGAFLKWCQDLHAEGTILLLAMTPAEWVALREAGEEGGLVSSRDLRFITPLKPDEAERLARTDEAKRLLPRLPAIWKRSPFLLELVFETAECEPDLWEERDWELLRTARERSEDAEYFYFQAVFENGLTEAQRAAVRDVARGLSAEPREADLLERCGLLAKLKSRRVIGDPILEANLCPLRIHHVSDVHFGPKLAERVDKKEKGAHAEALGGGLGNPRVCDHYTRHVAALAAEGRGPHLLVLSGDIAEWADRSQYAEATAWLEELRRELAGHPRLDPAEPQLLLVGGNHDVDWRKTSEPSGQRSRHQPFAEAFEPFPRARRALLDQPPEARSLAVARYPDLGVEVLLLGSAEFGGEEERDPVRDELLGLIARLKKGAMEEPDEARAAALRQQVSRIDPGLVHEADLERVRRTEWHAPVKIAVLHHPVSPMPGSELARFAGLINAGEVKDTLAHKEFCLILHGHAHTGWFGKEQWPERHEDWTIRIAAAPSLGSREIQEHNGYNEIEIVRDPSGGDLPYRVSVCRVVREGATWERRASMGPFAPGT